MASGKLAALPLAKRPKTAFRPRLEPERRRKKFAGPNERARAATGGYDR